jgi:hypothetical protein
MTNARLSASVDALVRAVRQLVPPGVDLAPLDDALGNLIAEALNAASAQSAGASLMIRDELHERLLRLEERERGA